MRKTNVLTKQEIKMINTFVKKERSERLLFEFSKDRNRAIDRFSHNVEEILNVSFIVKKTKMISDVKDFLNGIKSIYVSSLYDDGGKNMETDAFLEYIQESFGPIVGSTVFNVAVIKDEDGYLYLLKEKE